MAQRGIQRVATCVLIFGVALATGPARGQIPEWFGSYRTAANFDLRDARSGLSVKLSDFFNQATPTKNVVVLVFIGVACPIGDLYMPRLAELAEAYKDKAVKFLAVNSNAHDTALQVADHARRFKVPFPVLKDPGNVVADVYLVERTCEVIVIAGMREIRYRGAIDDQYGLETRKDAPSQRYLADALDAILAGHKVATPVTPVVGCPLDRVGPQGASGRKAPRVRAAAAELATAYDERDSDDPIDVGSVTYAGDVAAIFQQKCQSCHRPGQVGPFSLLSYDDTRRHAAMIREVVEERRMPPWHADPRYGHFDNDRSLSAGSAPWSWPGSTRVAARRREGSARRAGVSRGMDDRQAGPRHRDARALYRAGAGDGSVSSISASRPASRKTNGSRPPRRVPAIRRSCTMCWSRSTTTRRRPTRTNGACRSRTSLPMRPAIYPCLCHQALPSGSPPDRTSSSRCTTRPSAKSGPIARRLRSIFAKRRRAHEAHTLGIIQPAVRDSSGRRQSLRCSRATSSLPKPNSTASFLTCICVARASATPPPSPTAAARSSCRCQDTTSPGRASIAWREPRRSPKGPRSIAWRTSTTLQKPSQPRPARKVVWGEQTFEEMMIGYIDVSFLDHKP